MIARGRDTRGSVLREALVGALGALLVPSLAFASGHRGGHGGGGGGGGTGGTHTPTGGTATVGYGSSNSDVHYDPPPQPIELSFQGAPACIDGSDVLGIRQCTKFGEWSQNLRFPQIFVDAGMHVRHIPVLVYPGGAEMLTGTLATASALRIGVDLPAHLYAGVEGELGTAAAPALDAYDGNRGDSGTFLGGYGLVGARFGIRSAEFAFEAAGGERRVASAGMTDPSGGVLEARARGEVWLAPWVTAGGMVGASVLEKNDWVAGLYLGIHSRAFDGGR